MALALIDASTWRVIGSAMVRAIFPRTLVPSVGLKRCAGHHFGWGDAVQVRLHALTPRIPWLAGQTQLAGSARGGCAFRKAAPQEDQRG
jgi:hypothetical protein